MSATQQIPGSEAPTPIAEAKRANPIGLTALIVGGIALLASLIPLVNYFSGLIALAGLILGIVAWTLKGRKKTVAVLGTIVSLVALASSIFFAAFYTAGLASFITGLVPNGISPAKDISVVFEVTGDDGATATIGYSAIADSGEEDASFPDEPLPFTKDLVASIGGETAFSGFTLTAVSTNLESTVTCTITVDGDVVEEKSGGTTCSAVYKVDSRE
jgi:hypothetical protein